MVTLEVGLDASGLISGASTSAGALSSLTGAAMTMNMALQGSTAATTGFGIALSTAMPWLAAIGGALAGAAAMMGVWASSTREATSAWTSLSTAMDKAIATQKASGMLGLPMAGAIGAQQQSLFNSMRESQQAGAQPISFDDLRQQTRSAIPSQRELMLLIGQLGGPQAITDLATKGRFVTSKRRGLGDLRSVPSPLVREFSRDPSGIMISPEVAAGVFQQGYTSLGQQAFSQGVLEGEGLEPFPEYERSIQGVSPDYGYPQSRMFAPDGAGVNISSRQRIEVEKEHAALQRENLRNMAEMAQLATEIGGTLGNAAADFALGLRDGKSALAGIASQFSRMLITKGMTQATSWAFNSPS